MQSADLAVATGVSSADGPSIALDPPGTVAQSNRIGLTWHASSSLTSFTVFVQRAADQAFETVDAVVAGQSAKFARGPSYRVDFPSALVRVRCCVGTTQCVDSNEQPLLDALLGGIVPLSSESFGNTFTSVALSADGNTLAANASKSFSEVSNAQCEAVNAAVIVYQRATDGRWALEAVLDYSPPAAVPFAPATFALSGDGNTVVVGTPDEDTRVGAVQVFTRDAQHNWSRQAILRAAVPVIFSDFGTSVVTSHDGNRVLVMDTANRIYVFERGRIVQTGAYADLMKEKGAFAELARRQMV